MINLWQRVDHVARDIVPFAVAVFLTLVSVLPLQISGGAVVMPTLSLIAFFYWHLVRPDLMPVLAGFILGLLQDILSGAPLGLHALAYLLTAEVAARHWFGLFRESFRSMWLGFALTSCGLGVIMWLFYSLFNFHYISPDTYAVRLVITLFAFPPLVWAFAAIHRHILR